MKHLYPCYTNSSHIVTGYHVFPIVYDDGFLKSRRVQCVVWYETTMSV